MKIATKGSVLACGVSRNILERSGRRVYALLEVGERSQFVDRVCALDRAQLDDLAIIVKPERGFFAPLVVNVPSQMTGLFDDLLRVF